MLSSLCSSDQAIIVLNWSGSWWPIFSHALHNRYKAGGLDGIDNAFFKLSSLKTPIYRMYSMISLSISLRSAWLMAWSISSGLRVGLTFDFAMFMNQQASVHCVWPVLSQAVWTDSYSAMILPNGKPRDHRVLVGESTIGMGSVADLWQKAWLQACLIIDVFDHFLSTCVDDNADILSRVMNFPEANSNFWSCAGHLPCIGHWWADLLHSDLCPVIVSSMSSV